tara:strand:+ start:1047 stop:1169 length:123 start_codon:yes stop_codon:yes gene_type:complete
MRRREAGRVRTLGRRAASVREEEICMKYKMKGQRDRREKG